MVVPVAEAGAKSAQRAGRKRDDFTFSQRGLFVQYLRPFKAVFAV